jgi:hypothetical protein
VALITLPAATLLPSHDGRSSVVGELGTLLSKIHSNQQDFQALVPLLTKVIENAPDEEIWDAIYGLVPQPTLMTQMAQSTSFGLDPNSGMHEVWFLPPFKYLFF